MAKSIGVLRIKQDVDIQAPRQRVFQALVEETSAWWGSPYLRDEAAAQAMIIEPRLGGRMYEVWGEHEGAEWARVTAFRLHELLELEGRMALAGAVTGVVSFRLETRGEATRLHFTHHALGEMSPQVEQNYLKGWRDLLMLRLAAYVEKGVKYGIGHPPPVDAPVFDELGAPNM